MTAAIGDVIKELRIAHGRPQIMFDRNDGQAVLFVELL